ncbi:MAG: FAD-dependent oxidoreductase [Zoogloea oleivorans]|jgi:2,4-dienoyl-CoA reductase-like NADH-dependent reductase (Old Yellow Enzyme family)|uniref:oxidoreductase n=1 Tax=Zoogloea oleivorans TaxID=1552750 RepID=UPI002A36A445|nr:FAD-dependent oxidoreductase [Zoogloea oleivorans]MDY0036284.1 FAD-dependent oxidoreductase [Zoogloea oleivorans]
MPLTHVHTPINLGPVALKNRVVRTAHATNLGAGTMNDALIGYHLARAEGGVGLSIIEILSVHPSTPATLNVFIPDIGDAYRKLVAAVRPHGMKLFQQLWHGGHNALPLDGSPPWSASDVPSPTIGVTPVPMTQAMIDEIVAAYADTARKCEEWGLDGVEIHCAHGYLPAQFLSPNANRRSDGYGGSFENRLRFLREVVAAVRQAVSVNFAVGVRVAPDQSAGGIGVEDVQRAVQALEDEHLIDFVDVSLGDYHAFPKLIGGMHEPMGYEIPTSAPIARAARTPAIVTGRFRTLEEADQIIRLGDADLVALTRAHIADPQLVNKTLAGHPEQVRPCIACNQGCVGGLLGPAARMGCTVNPAIGAEDSLDDTRLTPVATPRRVLVVGGGPAGMEAARVAALRGHTVTLAEAADNLGGTLRIAARAPQRHGIADIAVWLEQEIYRLGVDVRLSSYLSADDIRSLAPDAVILATGSLPRMDGIQLSHPGEPIAGIARPHVLSSWDLLLERPPRPVKSAVVIDDVGHYEGIAAAEHLLAQGAEVHFVTRHAAFAHQMEAALSAEPALQRFARGRFTLHLRTRALAIGQNDVELLPAYLPAGGPGAFRVPAERVVFISHNAPNRELASELATSGIPLQIIGDANAPRFLPVAIREGRLAGMAV